MSCGEHERKRSSVEGGASNTLPFYKEGWFHSQQLRPWQTAVFRGLLFIGEILGQESGAI